MYTVLKGNKGQEKFSKLQNFESFLKKVLTKSSEYDRMYTAQKGRKVHIEPYN